MIDKLYLRFEDPPEPTDSIFPGSRLSDLRYSQAYRISWASKITGELCPAVIKLQPRISTRFYSRIEINPTDIPGIDDLFSLICELGLKPQDGEITRIDHCADLEDGLHDVVRGLHPGPKRIQRNYSSGAPTGFYYGKRPEQILVYPKRSRSGGLKTRIEIQQFASKCEVTKIERIHELLDHSPFERLRHFRMKERHQVSSLNRNYDRLSTQLEVSDFHTITASSRRARNFQRDMAPLFEETDLIKRASEIYQSELHAFLSGQWSDPTRLTTRVPNNDMYAQLAGEPL